jgi:hypothetical protein
VAWVDERAHLMLSELDASGFGAPRSLAEGLDRRFAPAVAHTGHALLVAFTRTVGEAMHVFVARRDGERATLEDLTPQGHGAAAPTFILGRSPPALVMVDAHAGMSPLLEVTFDDAGKASPAIVRTPVSQPYAPPALQAVKLSDERTIVAYSAVGRAAATAVGLSPLTSAEAPTPLVPSKGYGELEFSAAQQAGLSVFASEASKTTGNEPERALEVRVVDAAGAGDALVLGQGVAGDAAASASAPSLVSGERPGEFWLGYVTPEGARLAQLFCAP